MLRFITKGILTWKLWSLFGSVVPRCKSSRSGGARLSSAALVLTLFDVTRWGHWAWKTPSGFTALLPTSRLWSECLLSVPGQLIGSCVGQIHSVRPCIDCQWVITTAICDEVGNYGPCGVVIKERTQLSETYRQPGGRVSLPHWLAHFVCLCKISHVTFSHMLV